MGRKYNLEKAKQLLAAAGYANGVKTSIVYNNTFANVNILSAVQGSLAEAGIEVSLDAVDIGKYVTYLGPGTWPKNSAMLMSFPGQNAYFTGGLQFLFNQIGQSWLRTPELTKAYQIALNSSQPDVKLVQAVTNMMTQNALLIPIYVDTQAKIKAPYVELDFNNRGYVYYWNTESAWLNK
jgi:ABC-type transport system substrate-binding protein